MDWGLEEGCSRCGSQLLPFMEMGGRPWVAERKRP